MLRNIPNVGWLLAGAAITAYICGRIGAWGLAAYLLVGVLVGGAWLMFQNPKTDSQRFDIALCVPILAAMWPIMALVLALEKPWRSAKWKNRNASDSIPPSA
jgi:NhaP-type Na+/H+ or K+/H+ antiporter